MNQKTAKQLGRFASALGIDIYRYEGQEEIARRIVGIKKNAKVAWKKMNRHSRTQFRKDIHAKDALNKIQKTLLDAIGYTVLEAKRGGR